MVAIGVAAALNFPSSPQFCGQYFARAADKDLGLAVLRAYNDWHIDEWCGTYPGRMIPQALPPIWDPLLMADEVRRVAKKGCHAVTFSENPAAADLIWSPTLRKFPDLTFALSEGGIGWVPYFLERVDRVYKMHRAWTHQDFGDRLPSEVLMERIALCFIDDEFGIESRSKLNVDMRLSAFRLDMAGGTGSAENHA